MRQQTFNLTSWGKLLVKRELDIMDFIDQIERLEDENKRLKDEINRIKTDLSGPTVQE